MLPLITNLFSNCSRQPAQPTQLLQRAPIPRLAETGGGLRPYFPATPEFASSSPVSASPFSTGGLNHPTPAMTFAPLVMDDYPRMSGNPMMGVANPYMQQSQQMAAYPGAPQMAMPMPMGGGRIVGREMSMGQQNEQWLQNYTSPTSATMPMGMGQQGGMGAMMPNPYTMASGIDPMNYPPTDQYQQQISRPQFALPPIRLASHSQSTSPQDAYFNTSPTTENSMYKRSGSEASEGSPTAQSHQQGEGGAGGTKPSPKKKLSACSGCNKSKVRCDFQKPCAKCVTRQIPCIYPPPRPTAALRAKHAHYAKQSGHHAPGMQQSSSMDSTASQFDSPGPGKSSVSTTSVYPADSEIGLVPMPQGKDWLNPSSWVNEGVMESNMDQSMASMVPPTQSGGQQMQLPRMPPGQTAFGGIEGMNLYDPVPSLSQSSESPATSDEVADLKAASLNAGWNFGMAGKGMQGIPETSEMASSWSTLNSQANYDQNNQSGQQYHDYNPALDASMGLPPRLLNLRERPDDKDDSASSSSYQSHRSHRGSISSAQGDAMFGNGTFQDPAQMGMMSEMTGMPMSEWQSSLKDMTLQDDMSQHAWADMAAAGGAMGSQNFHPFSQDQIQHGQGQRIPSLRDVKDAWKTLAVDPASAGGRSGSGSNLTDTPTQEKSVHSMGFSRPNMQRHRSNSTPSNPPWATANFLAQFMNSATPRAGGIDGDSVFHPDSSRRGQTHPPQPNEMRHFAEMQNWQEALARRDGGGMHVRMPDRKSVGSISVPYQGIIPGPMPPNSASPVDYAFTGHGNPLLNRPNAGVMQPHLTKAIPSHMNAYRGAAQTLAPERSPSFLNSPQPLPGDSPSKQGGHQRGNSLRDALVIEPNPGNSDFKVPSEFARPGTKRAPSQTIGPSAHKRMSFSVDGDGSGEAELESVPTLGVSYPSAEEKQAEMDYRTYKALPQNRRFSMPTWSMTPSPVKPDFPAGASAAFQAQNESALAMDTFDYAADGGLAQGDGMGWTGDGQSGDGSGGGSAAGMGYEGLPLSTFS